VAFLLALFFTIGARFVHCENTNRVTAMTHPVRRTFSSQCDMRFQVIDLIGISTGLISENFTQRKKTRRHTESQRLLPSTRRGLVPTSTSLTS
jgi:hypothetical protein